MSDDDDHQVGRQVVGPVAGEIEAADRALVVNCEKRAKQATAPAARAPSSNTPPKGEADAGGELYL